MAVMTRTSHGSDDVSISYLQLHRERLGREAVGLLDQPLEDHRLRARQF
jgi:hypothetical protein